MIGFISKIFGGNKSEKDVKKIEPDCCKRSTSILPAYAFSKQ